jgi:glutathione S-transferase
MQVPRPTLTFFSMKASGMFYASMSGKEWSLPEVMEEWNAPYEHTAQLWRQQMDALERELALHGDGWVLPGDEPTAVDFTVFAMLDRVYGDALGSFDKPLAHAVADLGGDEGSGGGLGEITDYPCVKRLMDTINGRFGFGTVRWRDLRASKRHFDGPLEAGTVSNLTSQGVVCSTSNE